MTLSLRARLAVSSTVVFGVLLAGFGVGSYRILARRLDADTTARLTELTSGLHGYLRFDGDAPSLAFDASDSDQASFIHEATRYYQVYDAATGRLLMPSDGIARLGLRFTPDEVQAFREHPGPVDVATDHGRVRLSSSVIAEPTGRVYLLQVGVPLTPRDAALSRYRDVLLWGVPAALLAAAVAGRWLSGFALAPLERMAAAAARIDVNVLEGRLPIRGAQDELDRLAEAFNHALARLERAVGQMRQFSAALAHELRAPLTALRGEIELALRRAGADDVQRNASASQLEEIDRLKRLIDHILTLARAESGQIVLTFAPVDMGELAASLVTQIAPVAEARGIDLRCARSGALVVQGDAGWLERLLLNLLDNALKFTGEGGHVALRLSREGDTVRIEVRDTGIGMSPEVARQAFDRFFRADPARSSATEGAGLGLSLVRWIVDRHRGTIDVASRHGEGSAFTVTLPAAAPDGLLAPASRRDLD